MKKYFLIIFIVPLQFLYSQNIIIELGSFSETIYKRSILHNLQDDTLYFYNSIDSSLKSIHIDSVKYLKKEDESSSHLISGLLIGSIVGGILGYSFSNATEENDKSGFESIGQNIGNEVRNFTITIISVIVGGVAGSLIGKNIRSTKYVYFENYSKIEKADLIKQVITNSK